MTAASGRVPGAESGGGGPVASAPSETEASVSLQRPSIVILLGVLLVAAMVTTSPIAYWLLYSLGGLITLSYVWTRNAARSLELRRRLRGHQITVGDEVQEDFELVNTSRLPILLVEVDDHSELPGYRASVAESLGPRQRKRWISRGIAARRGLYGLGPTDLRIGDPFGIFASERRIDVRTTIVVYPPISIMADVEIPAGSMVGTSRSSIRNPPGHVGRRWTAGVPARRSTQAHPLALQRGVAINSW